MPKRFIQRLLPHHDKIREHKHLRIVRPLLDDPNLLHLNRRSVAGGVAVGLFFAWVPVPFQMVLSAIAAIVLRVNLPLSVVLVWTTNPITMPPMFYFAYKVGTWVLGQKPARIKFELTVEWATQMLGTHWQPFLLGCFIMAVVSSLVGLAAVRGVWRIHVLQNWKKRQARLQSKATQRSPAPHTPSDR
jgi:uncharacterized protein (DUF2062 family)